jgi:hypothetical protein
MTSRASGKVSQVPHKLRQLTPPDSLLCEGTLESSSYGFETDQITELDFVAIRMKRDSTASLDSVVSDPDSYTSLLDLRKVRAHWELLSMFLL